MLVKRKAERNKSKYLSYYELKEYVRINNILTKEQYINHVSKNYLVGDKNIPYNPSTFYSKDIWEGWSIFLRNEIYKKNYNGTYYNYGECKEVIKKYNFTSKDNFFKRIKDIIKDDIRIPYSPSTIYKKEWEGWIEFLDTDNDIEQITDLVSFEVARDYARSLNLKLQRQWYEIKWIDLPKGMTKRPEKLYRDKGWIDWYDFLGIDSKSKMSWGELIIANILDSKSIKYLFNKSLKDCISSSKLRFDFYLPDYNYCIEFDGIQHFYPFEFFGGEDEFEKLKIRDNIKNEWCRVNEIKILRLNYLQKMDEIENIVTEFIIEKEPKMGSILNLNYDSEKDITEVSLVEEKKTKKKKE
jgi:hypothetical protein